MQQTKVRPSIPLGHNYMKLTPLDQYMVRVILPMMCVFRLNENVDRSEVVRNLQVGLAHTIDEINVLAAYVVPEDPRRGTIQLEFEEDAGIAFFVKDMPGIRFDDLAKRNFPFSEVEASGYSPEPLAHTKKSPVMTVQLTFITGGLVLAFNGHHSVLDAQALGTFAETWARNVDAESRGWIVASSERIQADCLDGSYLLGGHCKKPLSEFQTYRSISDCQFQKTQRHILESAVNGNRGKQERLVKLSHWILPLEAIDRLKQATQPPSHDLPFMTENSLISALVWRCITRARRSAGISIDSSSILSSVNVRRRVEPPLPLEYVGNAIVLARANTPVDELLSDRCGSLYELAHQITDSINWWTSDRIWEFAGTIDASEDVCNLMHPASGYDVLITSPSRLGDVLGNASWGDDLGSIQALRFSFPAFMDGFVVVLPSIRGGQEIMIWTNPRVSMCLGKDSEWLQWASVAS
ncbi:hypothetical protein COCC4DRAFT_23811 [Bipolaris maydis ATCC 48331]|uniref:Trichothecene 3-O-acetyltransferase n=1 Tax=Cochliobolus heterostrophus (strain C4 / ATCC 48331 / race T) TaxID=665024 RepID=N4XHK9_COCH4|nr:uncharacterized protein COCC4DRAFT_23811 [Bipolaris maydis ATCC 48331]KAJ5025914.1 transferase family-domain-containing protein [Bipolaris maydis]ENI04582.1 hypothetical protein COCC4DRAFT_23811 [Bipolaris maydis ATCC 48331]KAJ5056446.1 transferase family-domain-containing protein [Bipolaris maydis]KAJ6196043.1 transferase family-domain-containing protein [Bipolaris maydis]KAJ6208133.1 transferase family-domain-containing protein [Bipolaris maydis]